MPISLQAETLPWHLPLHQNSQQAYDGLIRELASSEELAIAELHHTVQMQLAAYSIPALLSNGPAEWWTPAMEDWSKARYPGFFPNGLREASGNFFYEGHNGIVSNAIKAFAKSVHDTAKQSFNTESSLEKPIFLLIQSWVDAGYRDVLYFNPTAKKIADMGDAGLEPETAQHWLTRLGLWDPNNPAQSPIVAELTRLRDGLREHIQTHAEALVRCWVISNAVLAAVGHGPSLEDRLHLFDGASIQHSLVDAGMPELLQTIRQELSSDLHFQAVMLEASSQALRRGFLEEAAFAGCPVMTPKAGLHVQKYRYEQGDNHWRGAWDEATIQAAQNSVEQLQQAANALHTGQTPTLNAAQVQQCQSLFERMREQNYQSTGDDWIAQISAAMNMEPPVR